MNVAIIGCGLIGRKRAESLPPNLQLVGCFDADSETGLIFSADFKTKQFSSIEELLHAPRLDFVIIATRHDSLAATAILALEAGKHVFIEKPGARNHEELQKVFEKAQKQNLIVHIGYNHGFHPALSQALELFQTGTIGEIMFLRARYGHGGRVGYESEWRADKSKSGGGELIDQGTHLIDLAQRFLGKMELDYAATPTYFWNMPVEDNAFISLKNSESKIAFLHVSCTEWKNMFSLEIYGHNGKIEINGLGRSYGVETLTLHLMKPEMGPPESKSWMYPEPDTSWAMEMSEFVQDLKTGSKKSDNLASSLEVLRLISEIYARTNR